MESMHIILEGGHPRAIESNWISFHPVVLKNNIFKDLTFFNKSEDMMTILEPDTIYL